MLRNAGFTAAQLAALAGHADSCVLLIKPLRCTGFTALHLAALAGHADVVQLLVSHPDRVDINACTDLGLTALHLAASAGKLACLEALLAAPDLDHLAGSAVHSPVHSACQSTCNDDGEAVVRRLVEEWQSSPALRARLKPWFACDGIVGQEDLKERGFKVRPVYTVVAL